MSPRARPPRRRLAAALLAAVLGCGPRPGTNPAVATDTEASAALEPWGVVLEQYLLGVAHDGTDLYWVDGSRLRHAPLAGGEPTTLRDDLEAVDGAVGLVGGGGRLYVSDTTAVLAVPKDDAEEPLPVLELPDVRAMVADADALYVTDGRTVQRVPHRAGPARQVFEADGEITALAVSGGELFVGQGGVQLAGRADAPPTAAIHALPVGGGPARLVVAAEEPPTTIAVDRGFAWWTTNVGAVRRAPRAGGASAIAAPGRFTFVTADDRGAVIQQLEGLVAELTAQDTLETRYLPDGDWLPLQPLVRLAADWVVVPVSSVETDQAAVLVLPRRGGAPAIATITDESLNRVEVEDGAVYTVELARDGNSVDLRRTAPGRYASRRLARRPSAWVSDLAVASSGTVVFAEDQALIRASPSGATSVFHQAEQVPLALTIHRRTVYWVEGATLMARRLDGGRAFPVASAPGGLVNDVGAELAFDDDYLYLPQFGVEPGVARVAEDGRVDTVWRGPPDLYPGRDLVLLGGALYFANGAGVYRLDLEGGVEPVLRLGNDAWFIELAAAAGQLYAASLEPRGLTKVWRLDPEGPPGARSAVVLRLASGLDHGLLAADDTGVYVASEPLDAVFRLGHDAPAWVSPGALLRTSR